MGSWSGRSGTLPLEEEECFPARLETAMMHKAPHIIIQPTTATKANTLMQLKHKDDDVEKVCLSDLN